MKNETTVSPSFERFFSRQILLNEGFRANVMLVVLLMLVVYLVATLILYWHHFRGAGNEWRAFGWLTLLSLAVCLRTVNVRRIVLKWALRGKTLKPIYQYLNTSVEVSLPTVGIVVIAHFYTATIALLSPAVLIYFLIISLTVLQLDLKISLFAGLLAAVEYLVVVWWYFPLIEPFSDSELLSFWFIYVGKAVILLGAGIIAGMAARLIRQRTVEAHEASVERLRIEKIFGQQISPQIVDELLERREEMTSRLRHVCIMFLDLRNFTTYCEGKPPEEIVQFQNSILSFMIDTVNRHHGIVNQILGDGFMATFGAPISSGRDCRDALAASLDILAQLDDRNRQAGMMRIDAGIGLHFGEAVTGNVGTELRKQYSITGNVVITAARLEQLNKQYGSRLLVSREVLNQVDQGEYTIEPLGPAAIKGRNEPMEVFKLA